MGATLETTLQRMGFKQLNIRRGVCFINNLIQAGACLGFGLSKTPLMATVMNCVACLCDCFQGIGFSQNYYEVGGPDTAILTSVHKQSVVAMLLLVVRRPFLTDSL